MRTHTPLEHMQAMFTAFGEGDLETVRGGWHADAVWYPVTPNGDRNEPATRDEYLDDVLPSWARTRPDYSILDLELRELGGLVVAALTSTVGRGVLVYRVVDGKVAECWSINAQGRDSSDGF